MEHDSLNLVVCRNIIHIYLTNCRARLMTNLYNGENNFCILPTLKGWVYIMSIYGPLDGPLYTRAQYTPTHAHAFHTSRELLVGLLAGFVRLGSI